MSDYRVKVTVSNARIRKAIEAAGYTSVLQMCRVKSLAVNCTFNLVNMKLAPLTKEGKWRTSVLKLADALNVMPEDLFNEQQKVLSLGKNTSSKDVTEKDLLQIAAQYAWDERLEDMSNNEAVREIAEEQTKELINGALSALTPRERTVLTERFGFDSGATKTLDQVALDLNVTRERVRQIEAKALRKLRTSKTLSNLSHEVFHET